MASTPANAGRHSPGAVRPGAGAAGGVGYAAMTVLRAEPRPGVEVVLELVDLDVETVRAARAMLPVLANSRFGSMLRRP